MPLKVFRFYTQVDSYQNKIGFAFQLPIMKPLLPNLNIIRHQWEKVGSQMAGISVFNEHLNKGNFPKLKH